MDNMTTAIEATETYRQYINRRAHELRANYPDSTSQERREVLRQCEREYLTSIATLPRNATIAPSVGRSLVKMLGHAEASRMVRHVANFPECLPVNM